MGSKTKSEGTGPDGLLTLPWGIREQVQPLGMPVDRACVAAG